ESSKCGCPPNDEDREARVAAILYPLSSIFSAMTTSRPRLALTLLVLLGINTMNFFDRQVPGAVAEPLRKELQLSDKDLGWLTPAFLILYAVVGIPLGRWADTGRRTTILALGVILWSALTAVSG